MRASLFAAAFIASLGAQAKDTSSSTTVQYFSPLWDAPVPGATSFAASVAGINAEATTYHAGCNDDASKGDCNAATLTIIQGPETANFNGQWVVSASGTAGWDVTVTKTYDCTLKSWTESASCSMSASYGGTAIGGKTEYSSSLSTTYSTATSRYYDLEVTGGVKSFTAPEATETPGAAAPGPARPLITAGPLVAAAIAALL